MELLPDGDPALTKALAILRSGGCIAHATETCYGIACDLSNLSAVERLFAIKQRPATLPVSALFASVDVARDYVDWTPLAQKLADQYLPGPLTLVLPLRSDVSPRLYPLTANSYPLTIGVRISSHPLAMDLAHGSPAPIATTSANLHGQPEAYDSKMLIAQWKNA